MEHLVYPSRWEKEIWLSPYKLIFYWEEKRHILNKSQIEIYAVDEIIGVEKVYLVYSGEVFMKWWHKAET